MDKNKPNDPIGKKNETPRASGVEKPSALQRYLERQKIDMVAEKNPQTSASPSPDFQDLKPRFGLNSAYFMWAVETLSSRIQVELRDWRSRRREQKIETRPATAHTSSVSQFRPSGDQTHFVDSARPLTWVHAGFSTRFVAIVIDWIVLAMIRSAISRLTSASFFGQDPGYQSLTTGFTESFYWNILPTNFVLIWTVLAAPYYGYFYSQRGASLGKMAMGLQVVDARTGRYLTPWIAVFRETIGKVLSSAIFMIGYLMAALRLDRRAFHDLLFESVVVRVPPNQSIMSGSSGDSR